MPDILHILNGDSTREILEHIDMEGDKCVWRDVLSDGPAVESVGSDAFWKARTDYMCKSFDITPEMFEQKALPDFQKMSEFRQYKEVVLWFEYDLFCQVNLIALMHWFKDQDRGDTKISLICVGREEGYEKLVGLGEIAPDRYPDLFKRRRIMGTYDFTFASDAYVAWCSDDPTDLENFILLSSNEFPYLSDALQSHLQRFPSAQTGLSLIESKIVELINDGVGEDRKIVGQLLRWQEHYGFGDLQYFQVLDRMAPLFKEGEKIALKPEIATKLKEGTAISAISRDYNLGGAKASEWQWDQNTNELIPREISSL